MTGRSLGPARGLRLLWCPGLAAGTAAASGALEEIQISDCNFATPTPPRAGKPVPSQERPECLKSLWGQGEAQCFYAGEDGKGVNGSHTDLFPGPIWNFNSIVEKLPRTNN